MNNKISLLSLLLFLCVTPIFAQISLTSFSTGYYNPVDIVNCGDDRLFIVEQRGTIRICDTAGVFNTPFFLDITNIVKFIGGGDERGLLGLAFPPDYSTSQCFYVDYVSRSDGHTHISRFHVNPANPDSADPTTEEVLLSIYQPYVNHKGGRIAFGPDGYLYIGMGDGGSAGDPGNRAQNPDSLLGKILRLQVDPSIPGYLIPQTNPFALNPSLGRGEIWCMGMRNPWKYSFDRLTHELLIGDVGQDTVEEVDFQPLLYNGVRNCGWHCYEGNQPYNLSGGHCLPYTSYIDPVYTYRHNPGGYCSISGGYRYRGAKFQQLYGKYFFSDYCNSQLQYLEYDSSGALINTNLGILGGSAAIVAFGEDRWGELYCAALNSGIIYRIVSANCTPVATINRGKDTISDCGNGHVNLHVPSGYGFNYLWTLNGDTLSTTSTATASSQGMYVVHVMNGQTCSNSDSVYVNLVSPFHVDFAGLDTFYCNYSQPAVLTPSISGGIFTGPGMTDSIFNPSVAGAGFVSITYTYNDPSGCVYSHSQIVHVDACLNVPENVWTKSIGIFPNPSGGEINIRVYTQKEKKLTVEIVDIAGKEVLKDIYVLGIGEHTIPVKTFLDAGVYIIQCSDEYSSSSYKLIIQ